jgi:23S rRNA (uracil1939-C5)-methyltransferase
LVKIEKLVYGGGGLARVDGKVEFIPYSLPGEEWADGRLIQPSPDRVEARCSYFSDCGGCHYQQMPHAAQLDAKKAILEESLSRLGRIKPSAIQTVSGPEWRYRNRSQLHISGRRIGFHASGSNRLVDVDECVISSPAVQAAIAALRDMSGDRRFPRFLKSVELFSNESETLVNVLDSGAPLQRRFFDWCAERIPGATQSSLEYKAGGFTYRVSHKAFFQVNRFLIEPLIELALEGAEGNAALDLYAGVGLFSLPLTARFDQVTAVEVVGSAAHDLEFNADRAKLRLNAIRAKTEDFLAAATEISDFVLADPPRVGLGKRVVEQFARLKPRVLTIVSCDPTTLARDLAALISAGYAIDKMTMIDLFPQTFHIESVTRLVRD